MLQLCFSPDATAEEVLKCRFFTCSAAELMKLEGTRYGVSNLLNTSSINLDNWVWTKDSMFGDALRKLNFGPAVRGLLQDYLRGAAEALRSNVFTLGIFKDCKLYAPRPEGDWDKQEVRWPLESCSMHGG